MVAQIEMRIEELHELVERLKQRGRGEDMAADLLDQARHAGRSAVRL